MRGQKMLKDAMAQSDEWFSFCNRHFGRAMSTRFEKLSEEIGEVGGALIRGIPHEALEEIADCGLILEHMANLLGENLFDLMRHKAQQVMDRPEYKEAG